MSVHLENTIVESARSHLASLRQALSEPQGSVRDDAVSTASGMLNALLMLGHQTSSGMSQETVSVLRSIELETGELLGANVVGEQVLPQLEQTIVDTARSHLASYKHALKRPYNHEWADSVSTEFWMLNSLLMLGCLANSGLSDATISELKAIESEFGKVESATGLVKGEPLFHLQLKGRAELLPIHHIETISGETGYSTLLSIQQWEDGGTLLTVNDSFVVNPESMSILAIPIVEVAGAAVDGMLKADH